MKYSNELKAGAAIIASALVFFLGVRFFEDIPLFAGTYELYTTFDDAKGLLDGNAVRINGVNVGSVEEITLDPASNQVRIRFHVGNDIRVPEGSYTTIEGISALNSVTLALHPGPAGNPVVPEGGLVPSRPEADLLGNLTDRAPVLVDQVESVLVGVDSTLGQLLTLVQDPEGDLQQTLGSLRGSAGTADRLLRAERETITRLLGNLEQLTGDLQAITGPNRDSVGVAVQNLNQVIRRLDRNLASLEATTSNLDAVLAKVNDGEGTLGRLVNDPGLYVRLDSVAANLNQILIRFDQNPGRYLRELRVVDIF